MKSPDGRFEQRRCATSRQCCTPKSAPWSNMCNCMEQTLLAKMWPATHVIMGLHVAKQVRHALQAHAERIDIGNRIIKSWATQSARALVEGADDDESSTQRFALGLSQFRHRGVEIDIGGRLFWKKVCRAVFSAYELGWKGQIVSFDVSRFRSALSVEANAIAVRMLQACKGLRKVSFAFNKTLRRLTLDDISSVIASHPSLADVNVRSEWCRLSSNEAAKL
eukprot:3730906-Rhodomonas_salina.1